MLFLENEIKTVILRNPKQNESFVTHFSISKKLSAMMTAVVEVFIHIFHCGRIKTIRKYLMKQKHCLITSHICQCR